MTGDQERSSTGTGKDSQVRQYRPAHFYRIATGVLVLGVIWFANENLKQPTTLGIVAVVGLVIIAIPMVLSSLARASYDGRTLIYKAVLRAEHHIDQGQIEHVELGGRRTKALIIGYHPREKDGRIDINKLKFVNMVPLQDQEQLLEALGGETRPLS